MKYRKLIEDNFLIDEPKTGELVPFIFNKVQSKFYKEVLVGKYDIENKGLTTPVRENILKARREGFSSLILALFAADDIASANPTESLVISYKDDATKTFRKRYRTFILSFFARKKLGHTVEDIRRNPHVLDETARQFLSVDATDIELAHNHAHFYCGTASARVGGRGGVLQKLLFSEIAYYPDTEKVTVAEIVEGTMRQIDVASGWIFCESTENGRGTYQYRLWNLSKQGKSRFKNRFYGTAEFYSEKEIEHIRSEYVDMDKFRRDYPRTEDDLFSSSQKSFVSEELLQAMIEAEKAKKKLVFWASMTGTNYIDQCEILLSNLESLERKNPHTALYVGIDLAKQHDRTVMTVLADNAYAIRGGVKAVAIDSTGQGDFMPDWFEKNTRYYLIRVKFSRQTKDIMYTNLHVVIHKVQTSLPALLENGEYTSDDAKLFHTEMIELEKKIVGEMIVVAHPQGEEYHDDFPDSWALAEHAYVHINGIEARVKPTPTTALPGAVEKMLNRGKGNPQRKMIDSEYE